MNDTVNPNELAQERTQWALGRTVMALERTLMAWLRTAVSLISFGFTIYKVLDSLNDSQYDLLRPNAPRNVGLFLIFLGMSMLIVGIVEYRNVRGKLLKDSEAKVPFSMTFAASIGLLLVGVFTILNILFGFGGV